MYRESKFANFKDIIWSQVYYILSQEYIESESEKRFEFFYDYMTPQLGLKCNVSSIFFLNEPKLGLY